jgi:uncharacterized protein (DUF4415 family)
MRTKKHASGPISHSKKGVAFRGKKGVAFRGKKGRRHWQIALASTGDAWVDPDDAPELTQEQLEQADLYHGDKLVRPGRPPSANPKQALKLRIDADVVEHFRATGPGWQTRINDTLRRAAKLPRRKYEPIER